MPGRLRVEAQVEEAIGKIDGLAVGHEARRADDHGDGDLAVAVLAQVVQGAGALFGFGVDLLFLGLAALDGGHRGGADHVAVLGRVLADDVEAGQHVAVVVVDYFDRVGLGDLLGAGQQRDVEAGRCDFYCVVGDGVHG